MSRYLLRVTMGFTVGGVISVLGIWGPKSMLLTAMYYALVATIGGASLGKSWRSALGFGVAFALPGFGILLLRIWGMSLLYPVMSYAIGGAIGGALLGKGWRPVLGFGAAFAFPGYGTLLLLVMFQGLPSLEQGWPLMIPWFFMYAIPGGVGAAVSGLGWKAALAGMAAFGAGGSIAFASILIAMDLFFYVGPVIPYVLGAALLAVALEYPSHQRQKLGLCVKCGYDLRGSKERCPECGHEFVSMAVWSIRGT